MKYSTIILFPAIAAAALLGGGKKARGGRGGAAASASLAASAPAASVSGNTAGNTGNTANGNTGNTANGNTGNTANGNTGNTANGATAVNAASAGSKNNAGGANNAGAAGTIASNGLPQLQNPGPNLPVPTSFTPASQAVPGTSTAAKVTNQQAIAALQAAADNWSFDTGMVSNNQNTGKALANNAAKFQAQANIAYNAEVDELTHKAILDQIIGNDPDVSIANQTLTNGCFQSVVDNLQIMANQGPSQASLIDDINKVRCTQILPSIDTYLAVAARVIGPGATLRTAIRPDACAAIVKAAPASAFPGNLKAVNIRGNTDKVTNGKSFAGTGSPSVQAPANSAASPSTGTTTGAGTTTGKGGRKGGANAGTAAGGNAAASASPSTAVTAGTNGATTAKGKRAGKATRAQKVKRSLAFVA
ncbi:hypothetical protein E2P81_ATG04021 [Venturia nashicola]|uniref:Uncharacterized protein n=1 Tax=Venturia nashicola TaxID=86259 RepID=A0A4Z1PQK9_9PEZI|nr:hypothetical protein E6O75_ATG04119 [Venturia nashicola]TLD37209.1 hypothetical protein E2P81_ATG04021 [Venturia nashicola]